MGAEVGEVTKDNALDKINGWVNEKTHGKISSVIDNNLFEAMLINAVYFKARWAGEFSREATKPDIFTNGDGTKSETDFMNKTARLDYCEFNGIQIVELPYANYEDKTDEEGNNVRNYLKDFDFSMYLLMSDEEFSPEYILNNALPLMESAEIQLSMPKFVIEYSASMNDILMNLGIDKAFTPQAEFYNMFDGGNMFITGVIHKAYIDVNERETEAAAVTAVAVGRGAAVREKPPEIKFNKPFTFVIRDNISGETLFVGEYAYVEE